MKHKAQEALRCIALNYDAEYVNECNDNFCKMMKCKVDTIQQTTDCQLTVEEIRTIATALNHLEVDYLSDNLLNNEKKSLKRIPIIRTKLLKQKEMWEEE